MYEPQGDASIPVDVSVDVEFREIVERLEKLPLHPDVQPDLGAQDVYEEPPGNVQPQSKSCKF